MYLSVIPNKGDVYGSNPLGPKRDPCGIPVVSGLGIDRGPMMLTATKILF